MRRVTAICCVLAVGVVDVCNATDPVREDLASIVDVRAYLANGNVVGLYRSWVARNRPIVAWGTGDPNQAGYDTVMDNVAWGEVARAIRCVGKVKEEDLGMLISATCLACRAGASARIVTIQGRAGEHIERLCIEVQKRLVEHPEEHARVPLEDVRALLAAMNVVHLRQEVANLESRMAEERRAVEVAALARMGLKGSAANQNGVARSAKSTDGVAPRTSASVSRDIADGNGITVGESAAQYGDTVEGLFARSWLAMGMPPGDELDCAAIRCGRQAVDPNGGHSVGIVLGQLVIGRASLVAVVAIAEVCRTNRVIPLGKNEFLAAEEQVEAEVRRKCATVPARCVSSERVWKFAAPSIVRANRSIRGFSPDRKAPPSSSK